jgi:hypothetical protein
LIKGTELATVRSLRAVETIARGRRVASSFTTRAGFAKGRARPAATLSPVKSERSCGRNLRSVDVHRFRACYDSSRPRKRRRPSARRRPRSSVGTRRARAARIDSGEWLAWVSSSGGAISMTSRSVARSGSSGIITYSGRSASCSHARRVRAPRARAGSRTR